MWCVSGPRLPEDGVRQSRPLQKKKTARGLRKLRFDALPGDGASDGVLALKIKVAEQAPDPDAVPGGAPRCNEGGRGPRREADTDRRPRGPPRDGPLDWVFDFFLRPRGFGPRGPPRDGPRSVRFPRPHGGPRGNDPPHADEDLDFGDGHAFPHPYGREFEPLRDGPRGFPGDDGYPRHDFRHDFRPTDEPRLDSDGPDARFDVGSDRPDPGSDSASGGDVQDSPRNPWAAGFGLGAAP
jgi:hypothetical protein